MIEVLIFAFGICAFANSTALMQYATKQRVKWPWVAFSIMMGGVGILCISRLLGKSLFFYPESGVPGDNIVLFTLFPVAWLIALIVLSKSIGRERLEKRVERLRTLNDIALRFQHEIASNDIPELIISQLERLVPSDGATLFLVKERDRAIYPVYEKGVGLQSLEKDKTIAIARGGELEQALDGKARLLRHSILSVHQGKSEDDLRGGGSILAISLLSKNRPIGIIEIRRSGKEGFSVEEIEIVTLLAQQAAIIYENSKLLMEMEQEKDASRQYLDLLSHDIANLNTPLYSYFDMMLTDSKLDNDSKKVVDKVYKQVNRISSLVTRVRKLSRTDETWDSRSPIACDPLKKLEAAIVSLRTVYPEKEIPIEVNDETGSKLVNAGEILDEIFFNVLNNAMKHSKKGIPRVKIDLHGIEIDGREFISIEISDDGSGVADDFKESIFMKRKDSTASFARGFDLDLHSCRKYIESWEGKMWIDDRIKGRSSEGACFVISLLVVLPPPKAV